MYEEEGVTFVRRKRLSQTKVKTDGEGVFSFNVLIDF